MPRSKAKTVAEYLAQLPEDRRATIAAHWPRPPIRMSA